MKALHFLTLAAVIAIPALSRAEITIATFSDPTTGSEVMFDWDMTNNTLVGSWQSTGLELLTPGFNGGGQVNDAKFTTSTIQLTEIVANVLYQMGGGTITFTDAANNAVMNITFDGGLFQNPLTVGAASSQGNNVNFSGPNVPNDLIDEAFSFSLANPTQNGNHMTFSASFTSSANVIPEPASIIALGAGLLAVLRRRRA